MTPEGLKAVIVHHGGELITLCYNELLSLDHFTHQVMVLEWVLVTHWLMTLHRQMYKNQLSNYFSS